MTYGLEVRSLRILKRLEKMNAELTQSLFDAFPRLFRNRQETSMQYGFDCGDGWFDLIYKLSQDIEAVARENGVSPDLPEWPWCRGVKQKFGSLRFHVFGNNERIYKLRYAASIQSFQICEHCGAPGQLLMADDLRVLCLEHAKQLCPSAMPVDWHSVW